MELQILCLVAVLPQIKAPYTMFDVFFPLITAASSPYTHSCNSSKAFVYGTKTHFRNHYLIMYHFHLLRLHRSLNVIVTSKATKLLLSISAPSANSLFSISKQSFLLHMISVLNFQKKKKKSGENDKHASELLFISSRTKPEQIYLDNKENLIRSTGGNTYMLIILLYLIEK